MICNIISQTIRFFLLQLFFLLWGKYKLGVEITLHYALQFVICYLLSEGFTYDRIWHCF